MGFAWHKLAPRREEEGTTSGCPAGPSGCDGPIYSGQQCISYCYSRGDTGLCLGYLDYCWTVTGQDCSGYVLESSATLSVRGNPGCPQEYNFETLNTNCTVANIPNADQRQYADYPQLYWNLYNNYYYRTPTFTSSTPSSFKMTPMCITYETMTVPDRVQVISGRNRYKYMGHLAGEYSTEGTQLHEGLRNLALGSSNPNSPAGMLGIKGFEESLGRAFPLANSYVQLPLFGGLTTSNPDDPCFDFCYSVDCISCRPNAGIGHYSGRYPNGPGNENGTDGKGYYSFQCFNPEGWFTDIYDTPSDSGNTTLPQDIPLCSLWSLINAISEKVGYSSAYGSGGVQTFTSGYILNPNTIFALDPTALTGQVQMVAWVMNQYANAVNNHDANEFGNPPTGFPAGFKLVPPRVFLWDSNAVLNASSTVNKWKNIFVIGNQNVIYDTGCTHTHTWDGASWTSATGSDVFTVDEVSHSPSTVNSARLIIWQGCNANAGPIGAAGSVSAGEPTRNNNNSKMRLSIKSVPCASPKGTIDWCSECAHPGESPDAECSQSVWDRVGKFC